MDSEAAPIIIIIKKWGQPDGALRAGLTRVHSSIGQSVRLIKRCACRVIYKMNGVNSGEPKVIYDYGNPEPSQFWKVQRLLDYQLERPTPDQIMLRVMI